MRNIPWVGLLAVISMFILPLIPDWLFEGPRNVKHWPRRHICAICRAPWTDDHRCDGGEERMAVQAVRGEPRQLERRGTHPLRQAIAAPTATAIKEPRGDGTTEGI
jgi:hypothetical protein